LAPALFGGASAKSGVAFEFEPQSHRLRASDSDVFDFGDDNLDAKDNLHPFSHIPVASRHIAHEGCGHLVLSSKGSNSTGLLNFEL
jgi:hypothetical protein